MKNVADLRSIVFFAWVIIMILGCMAILLACLDPVNFNPDPINVQIGGEISTTDVTAAVLMITNRSKTTDVTKVTITQPEWTPANGSSNAQAPYLSFANRPKRLEKKAQYLAPSDKSYQVVIEYAYDALKEEPAGTGSQTLLIPLPIPRQIVELFIFRTAKGEVIIDTVVEDPDADDTGNPPAETSHGEGSVPSVIPPEYRNTMATFIVISKTNSQNIDSVNFKMGTSDYTMGSIGANNRQSIALSQGGWETRVTYTRNADEKTLGPVNSIIVPSNDPQSIKEHYLYFYLNKRGEYAISQEWPPSANDVEEEDVLPPDDGFGRGLVKIINNSYAMAKKVTIHNVKEPTRLPIIINYEDFSPSIPVQYKKTGFVDVVGTEIFPIEAHEYYLIQVTLETNDSTSLFEQMAYIKDQVVTIVIEANDNHLTNVRGAKVELQNQTHAWPVDIVSLTVRNAANVYQSSYFTAVNWIPAINIASGKDAVQYIMSTPAMPIAPNVRFNASLAVFAAGKTAVINKEFDNPVLYSEDPPDQNVRKLTITDDDIPDEIKDVIRTTAGATFILQNRIGSWPVQVIGLVVKNKVRPDERMAWGLNVGYNQDATQTVRNSTVMPIREGEEFIADVALSGGGEVEVIEKTFTPAELFNTELTPELNTRTITVRDTDVPQKIIDALTGTKGAKVIIENKVTSWPVQIRSMTVQNKTTASQSAIYPSSAWTPVGDIGKDESANVMVMSSATMPITDGVQFRAILTLYGCGETATVTKDFSPATLFSEMPAEQNTRNITITDTDVPQKIIDAFNNTRGAKVTIKNEVKSSWPIQVLKMTVVNTAAASEKTEYTPTDWVPAVMINNNDHADVMVMHSAAMPIRKDAQFKAEIEIIGNGNTEIITKEFDPAVLYSVLDPTQNTRLLVITDNDIPENLQPPPTPPPGAKGATFTLVNGTSTYPAEIIGLTVRNQAAHNEVSSYGIYSWTPNRGIASGESANAKVLASQAMPIINGAQFEAFVTIYCCGEVVQIPKAFTPAALFDADKTPEANIRVLTITDSDMTQKIIDAYSRTRGATVTIRNDATLNVQILGMTVQNKTNTAQSAAYGIYTWTPAGSAIDKNRTATQLVMSSASLPIKSGVGYKALLTVYGYGQIATIAKEFSPTDQLYSTREPASNPFTVTLTDTDLPKDMIDAYNYTRGATVTVYNNVRGDWPIMIVGMKVQNKAKTTDFTNYGTGTWQPADMIVNKGNLKYATQIVKSSAAMPITETAQFEALLTIFGNGNTAVVRKDFTPRAELYGDPATNTRSITLVDTDVPFDLQPVIPPPPPTPDEEKQDEIAEAEIGDLIVIDGIVWVKVKSDGDNVLLLKYEVITNTADGQGGFQFHPNVNFKNYSEASVKGVVDSWYSKLPSGILKKIALVPILADNSPSENSIPGDLAYKSKPSSPGAKAGLIATDQILFIPRYADIMGIKDKGPTLLAYYDYWLADFINVGIGNTTSPQPYMGMVVGRTSTRHDPAGTIVGRDATAGSPLRPAIWVTTKH